MTSDQGEAWVVTRGKWVVMTRGIGSDKGEVGSDDQGHIGSDQVEVGSDDQGHR